MDQNQLNNLRHSCAHLLAAAVMELWPDTKRAIGPAIEDGFYYDFDFAKPISEDDLPKIEAKMKELLSTWEQFTREEVSVDEARKKVADNPYKLELIDEFAEEGKNLTFYKSVRLLPDGSKSGNFEDLCKGGHAENPSKEIGAFKLLSIAGAYWRGTEKNKMLTRIYGTCFKAQTELDDYLQRVEDAKQRDHRKIGKELGLFVFSDLVGKGLPLLTPKGTTIRRELERFIVDEELKRGYQHIITPPLAKVDLYRTSGHYPYYKDTMYPPMKIDEDELILRPMTCPHHFMLYKSEPHSYKELPIRYAELSPQFRYEKSGELTGLMRVRMFTLADAHIICTLQQAKQEIKQVLELIDYVNQIFGLKKGEDYHYRLSLGNRKEDTKYYKDDDAWETAENVLRKVLQESGSPFEEAENEAAFYGPKIDIQMKNVLGKEETAFTLQYDFVQPKRFELKYADKEGHDQEPVVIHRSSLGAFERVMAFLIEKYGGAFPTWLAPTQVMIVPIAERHTDYAQKVLETLQSSKIRAEVNDKSDTMQSKIRDAQLQKIPYILVVGDREEKDNTVAVRTRGSKESPVLPLSEFLDNINEQIESKAQI